jgi:hypothetical protein
LRFAASLDSRNAQAIVDESTGVAARAYAGIERFSGWIGR